MSPLPPPPPPFFTSTTPGYSVVMPDEPKKSRELIVLFVVGCLAAAVLAGGVMLLTRQSRPVSPFLDSRAATTAVATDVTFLVTRSPISGSALYFDLSRMDVGTCFIAVERNNINVPEVTDCAHEHYYQFYAVGVLPETVTKYSQVDESWNHFCADQLSRFVGANYIASRFNYSGSVPAFADFPTDRSLYCFLYVPGEFGWIGSAENSGQ